MDTINSVKNKKQVKEHSSRLFVTTPKNEREGEDYNYRKDNLAICHGSRLLSEPSHDVVEYHRVALNGGSIVINETCISIDTYPPTSVNLKKTRANP